MGEQEEDVVVVGMKHIQGEEKHMRGCKKQEVGHRHRRDRDREERGKMRLVLSIHHLAMTSPHHPPNQTLRSTLSLPGITHTLGVKMLIIKQVWLSQ